MVFSRMAAAICVVVFIGLVALAGIGIAASIGTAITHGSSVEHVNGIIQPGYVPGHDLEVKVKDGPLLQFACQQHCLNQTGHIQRHINEQAPTDVYYINGPGTVLIAIDVD